MLACIVLGFMFVVDGFRGVSVFGFRVYVFDFRFMALPTLRKYVR